MKLSRQTLLGSALFLGGGVMLFAMLQQLDTSNKPQNATVSELSMTDTETDSTVSDQPLTADIETEQRILAQKQKERAARVAEQERRAKEFLAEQERAEALALNKSRLENEQYRNNNVIEAVPDTQLGQEQASTQANNTITTPVVQPRVQPVQPTPVVPVRPAPANEIKAVAPNKPQVTSTPAPVATPPPSSTSAQSSNREQSYQVRRGDGLIKIARQHNVPVDALVKANNISINSSIHEGQALIIPSAQQVKRLQQQTQTTAKVANDTKPQATVAKTAEPEPKPTTTAPTRAIDYSVKSGDGLIKLSRQYNVPVDALAQANNISTSASLNVGQKLIIPSQAQITRLQREAQQAQRRAEAAKTAEQRLAQARQAAAQGEAKGTFGVQVALADNQAKADEVAKKMRAAGYRVTTSQTSRGVRVIVGPETGKPAALALKDKINADPRTGVDRAWVLYWR